MNGKQQNDLFMSYLKRMEEIRGAKNKDYANDTDSLANFRMVEGMGLPAWVGIVVRLGDKYARMVEQARKVTAGEELTFAVSSEGFDDTVIDLANYALLAGIAFEEWKETQTTKGSIIRTPRVDWSPVLPPVPHTPLVGGELSRAQAQSRGADIVESIQPDDSKVWSTR